MTRPRSTEHGLLMSGPMALAAFRGVKTQTRRPLKLTGAKAADLEFSTYTEDGADFIWRMNPSDASPYVAIKCHYGRVGDLVYVREAWTSAYAHGCWGTLFRADGVFVQGKQRHEKGAHYNAEDLPPGVKWRPSLHLPKWASRTWGAIASVRVEQVQSITEADAIAEGMEANAGITTYSCLCGDGAFYETFSPPDDPDVIAAVKVDGAGAESARDRFARLWGSLYTGELSWSANPWVWVVEWKKEEKP